MEQKFQAAIETEDVQERIKERLFQERARLERDVEAKIAEERRLQLLRKRKDQEQRLKEQARTPCPLEDSHKLSRRARARAAELGQRKVSGAKGRKESGVAG